MRSSSSSTIWAKHHRSVSRDDTSWDTNIEEGIYWGVRMFELDEELYGERLSAKAFIVLSDGQAWSGEVDTALELARERGIRVYVIGVGSTAGGFIPQLPASTFDRPEDPIHSVLDRRSLRAIAEAGGGEYYELGVDADQDIAPADPHQRAAPRAVDPA